MGPYFGRTGGLMRRDQEFMGTEEREERQDHVGTQRQLSAN